MLDERPGVSYPDGQQTPDGPIRIIYDFNRTRDREILMATFREEDVAAGRDASGAVRLRQLVGKASGGREKPAPAAPAQAPATAVTQELLNSIHVPPRLIHEPFPASAEKYLPIAMAAGIESTRKGRLWTCWAGGQDGPNAYLPASYSDDSGRRGGIRCS